MKQSLTDQDAELHERLSADEKALVRRHQKQAPVDVRALAADLGLNVYKDDLGQDVSGVLKRDARDAGPSGWVVLVNTDHNRNRQRFTIAHEIGHFLLHRERAEEEGEVTDDYFYRAFSSPIEQEANAFAADLLMPTHLLARAMDDGFTHLDDLARLFRVSKQSMAIRLGVPYDQDWE
ncbi:MAG: ImmA/IrrE family metallo-endopeptidase [Pseudomonadota bacterium]